MKTAGIHEGRRVRQCLRGLLTSNPYFGSLALRLPIVADSRRENIATDGKSLFFSPSWVEEHTSDEIVLRIADCVLGCALKHHTRRGDRDYKRWQQAHQQVTLPLLRNAGLTDEPGGLDMSIEQAFELIPEPPEGDTSGDDQSDGDGGGEGAGGGSAAGRQGGDGGNDGQQPESYAAPGAGEILDSPGAGEEGQSEESARQQAEQEWDEAGKQALAMARSEGREPGNIAELIDAAGRAPASWRDILRRHMTAAAKRDYSWAAPQRRLVHMGLYLPSLRSDGMGHLAFAIDTSGSLDESALAALWGELKAATEEVEPDLVTVIQCDTRVTDIAEYDRYNLPDQLTACGRGGTDYAPVFDAVNDLPEPPAVLIFQTDGFCDSFGQEPACDVIWALEPHSRAAFDPPFGEVVRLT